MTDLNPVPLILRRDDRDPLVERVKRRLGFARVTDEYDISLEQRVRGFQLSHKLDPHGQLDAVTLTKLGIGYVGTGSE